MTGDVTVIVPVWNRRDLLARVLDKLQVQTYPIEEVLVVDDASRDGSAEFAEAMGARAIRMPEHGGFARAVNRGIRETRTPLAAILNNDVEPTRDWLETLHSGLADDAWFAAGRILQADNPGLIDATYDAVCRGGTPCRIGNGRRDGPVFREPRRIWSAPFTAVLYRMELFERIGLLDERFESYLEDVDFGLRCALEGCGGVYVPDAVAFHQGSATMGRWHPETVALLSRNQVFLVAKYFSRGMLIRYAWPVFIAHVLWGLVALRHGRGPSWLQGKVEGIRRFDEFRTSAGTDTLAPVLRDGERQIRRIQKQAGAGLYWTLYFLLTPHGTK